MPAMNADMAGLVVASVVVFSVFAVGPEFESARQERWLKQVILWGGVLSLVFFLVGWAFAPS